MRTCNRCGGEGMYRCGGFWFDCEECEGLGYIKEKTKIKTKDKQVDKKLAKKNV